MILRKRILLAVLIATLIAFNSNCQTLNRDSLNTLISKASEKEQPELLLKIANDI